MAITKEKAELRDLKLRLDNISRQRSEWQGQALRAQKEVQVLQSGHRGLQEQIAHYARNSQKLQHLVIQIITAWMEERSARRQNPNMVGMEPKS